MAATAMTWINAHVDGRASGFAYFNLYVNPGNAQVLGWVAMQEPSASEPAPPYLFYYYLGDTGEGLGQGTRGSARHAMDAVDGAIARAKVTVGLLTEAAGTTGGQWPLSIAQLTRQILAHEAIVVQRGW